MIFSTRTVPLNADPSLCICCADEPKVERSSYGKECKKAYNNIEKQEAKETQKKGERWQRWQETKRCGGAKLNAIIMKYRDTVEASRGSGVKRGKFDLAYHFEQMDSVAKVGSGEKLVYMPFSKWYKHGPKELGLDIQETKQMWLRKKKTLPQSQHRKTSKGVLLLPMPYEIFIVGENSTEHRKGMRLERTEAQEAIG